MKILVGLLLVGAALLVIGCDKTIHEARLDRTPQNQSLASAQR